MSREEFAMKECIINHMMICPHDVISGKKCFTCSLPFSLTNVSLDISGIRMGGIKYGRSKSEGRVG